MAKGKKEVNEPPPPQLPKRKTDSFDTVEQLYLIEIFLDQITIIVPEDEDSTDTTNKNFVVKVNFGPNCQLVMYEGRPDPSNKIPPKKDVIQDDDNGRKTYTRNMRVGKTVLLTSCPISMLELFYSTALEFELWNDDIKEGEQIFVGIGREYWNTNFFHYLKETMDVCKTYKSISIKNMTTIYAECCCKECAQIANIVRISAFGEMIVTDFKLNFGQQESFLFKTNKVDSAYDCKKVAANDPNFALTSDTYESKFRWDPKPPKKIEVCTELQSCAIVDVSHSENAGKHKTYPTKIRMGDIRGPCGNTICPLAHKIKNYIRNMDAYKKVNGGMTTLTSTEPKETEKQKRVCGSCSCRNDLVYQTCPPIYDNVNALGVCNQCGGGATPGFSCAALQAKLYGTGVTPKSSPLNLSCRITGSRSDNHIHYMTGITRDPQKTANSPFGRDYIVNYNYEHINDYDQASVLQDFTRQGVRAKKRSMRHNDALVYNVVPKNNLLDCDQALMDSECVCNPPKPNPPCGALDCACILKAEEQTSRKLHKPYCPRYRHKPLCPISLMKNAEENATKEEEPEDAEAEKAPDLPYGLTPIKLGPCPVMGRPCTVPDGFSRMYKVEAMEKAPLSYSEAGKICCTKEFERIKKAIQEYTSEKVSSDKRCVKQFNIDTERRCCDKNQKLLPNTGKSCCGPHILGDK